MLVGENFEALSSGDQHDIGPLDITVGDAFLVNNDNSDLTGLHLDGDSANAGGSVVISFDQDSFEAPSSGAF